MKSLVLKIKKDGKRIAIEIETGKSDAVYNIRKDLESNFDKVICIGLTDKVKNDIVSQLKDAGLARNKEISISALKEFKI